DRKLNPEALGVLIEVDTGDLQLTERDSRWTGQVDMLILQLDADGNELTGIGETQNLNLQADNYRKALANGLGIQRSMPRAAQTVQLRVLLRAAASGAIGSLTMPLDVVK